MKIPLLDLKREYEEIEKEASRAVLDVLRSGEYILGGQVEQFESEFAQYLGVRNVVTVGNGTDALILALLACGIGRGDEVITTPFTFFATAEAIARVGAVPVFADVLPGSFNLDPNHVEDAVTFRTRAILPVHLFGQSAGMEELEQIAQRHSLRLITDSCQAAGARYQGSRRRTVGEIGCYSFFPTKNLGCAGDGGAVATDDPELATVCRALRAHGGGACGRKAAEILGRRRGAAVAPPVSGAMPPEEGQPVQNQTVYHPEKYYNELIGFNTRLDALQAALLRVKLPLLEGLIQRRRAVAGRYREGLAGGPYLLPDEDSRCYHSYHQFVLRHPERDRVCRELGAHGIATGVYYPVPLHLQRALAHLGYHPGDFPIAEELCRTVFALPISPTLGEEEQQQVIRRLREVG